MKKYSVRLYFAQYADVEAYAENKEDAIDVARSRLDYEICDWSEKQECSDPTVVQLDDDAKCSRVMFEEWLYDLCHERISWDDLIKQLRERSGIPNLTIDKEIGDDDCTEYNAAFDIYDNEDGSKHPLAGEFDIYYLPLRKSACESMGYDWDIYITEVNVKFGHN